MRNIIFFPFTHCAGFCSLELYIIEKSSLLQSDIEKNCDLPTKLLNRSGVELKYNFRATILKSEHKIME